MCRDDSTAADSAFDGRIVNIHDEEEQRLAS